MSPEEWLRKQGQQAQPSAAPMSPEQWLASQKEPETTATGLAGAVTRGLALPAAGAAVGAAMGAPFAGIGAVPGAIAGAGAATLAQLIGDPVVNLANRLMGTNYAAPTQAMQDLLTRIGVAKPDTEAERIVEATAAGAASAGGLSAIGKGIQMAAGAARPVTRAVGAQLAAQPVAQIAGGAGAGLAAQSAQEMGIGTGGQIAASLAGGIAGARLATPRPTATAPKIMPPVEDTSKLGIPVMTSDVRQPSTFLGKTAQQLGERVPIAGTSGLRATQQQARIDAVRNVLQDFGADDAANLLDDARLAPVTKDVLQKRGDALTKYTQMKNDVFSRVDAKGAVPVTNATMAIDDEIARLNAISPEGYAPVTNLLERFKTDIQGKGILNIEGNRKLLGGELGDPTMASIRSEGEKSAKRIYNALNDDIGDFIKTQGERRDFTKWKVANKNLSEMAGELQNTTMKAVLRGGKASPEDVSRLLFSKKPSDIRVLHRNLTPEGRANARVAILSQAAKDAVVKLPDGSISYSPEKFNLQIQKLKPQVGIFFQGKDLQQIEGLSRALSLTRRAGEAAVSTSTGQQAVPFVAGSFLVDLLGSFGASIAAAGGVGAMARVYESAPVRNLMMKLPQTAKGSQEEAALVKRLISTMQTQAQSLQSEEQETQ